MNRTYEMVFGDSIRTFRAKLYSNEQPEEAILVLSSGANRLEFELSEVGDVWQHRFTEPEVDDLLLVKNWKGQIVGSFSDGSQGTYPTRGYISFRVYKKL
jgi:hypothetical protein